MPKAPAAPLHRVTTAVCVSTTKDGGAFVPQAPGQGNTAAAAPSGEEDDVLLRAIAACALDPHVPGVRAWNYLPKRIHVGTVPPRIKQRLDDFLTPLGVIVEVKPRLQKMETLREAFADMEKFADEIGDEPEPPALMEMPGMTLERVRAFAEACREYFKSRAWNRFAGWGDLWRIEPAPQWPELGYCQTMGDSGLVYGVGFFASPEQYDQLAAAAATVGPERAFDAVEGVVWSVLMDEPEEAIQSDVMLWERESLPTLGREKRIPTPVGASRGACEHRPTPEMLTFMEAALRGLSKGARGQIEAGEVEVTVPTFDGPRELRFVAMEPVKDESKPGRSGDESGALAQRTDLDRLLESLGDSPIAGNLRKMLNAAEKPSARSGAGKKSKKKAPARPTVKPAAVYQLKVTLDGIRPPIWRRLLVRDDATLHDLHAAIQHSFGWENDHLHSFDMGGRRLGGSPMGAMPVDSMWDDGGEEDSGDARLNEFALAAKSKFKYTYDFGDDWEHQIIVEKVLTPEQAEAAIVKMPGVPSAWRRFTTGNPTPIAACVGGARAGPPEDCGGCWGYGELCEIMADPDHPEREERAEWLGGFAADPSDKSGFHPERFEIGAVNKDLAKYPRA